MVNNEFIYKEIELPYAKRSIPSKEFARDIDLAPFQQWSKKKIGLIINYKNQLIFISMFISLLTNCNLSTLTTTQNCIFGIS